MLEHALSQALKPFDITPTQYNVLRILRGAGAGRAVPERSGRTARAARAGRHAAARPHGGDRVAGARARDDADRRYVTARISAQGLAVLERLDREIHRIHRSQLGHVDRKQLRA